MNKATKRLKHRRKLRAEQFARRTKPTKPRPKVRSFFNASPKRTAAAIKRET